MRYQVSGIRYQGSGLGSGFQVQRLQRIGRWRAATSKQTRNGGWIETLADKVTVHAPDGERVVQCESATETAVERLFEQVCLVEVREYFRDRLTRNVAVDAERLDPAKHSCAASMANAHLRARAGESGPPIVQGTLAAQPLDGRVDFIRIELTFDEPRPQLRFRKLATGEEREAGDVGPVGVVVRHRLASEPGDLGCAAAGLGGGRHLIA